MKTPACQAHYSAKITQNCCYTIMTAHQPENIGIQYELRQLATATTELAERIDDMRESLTTGFERTNASFDRTNAGIDHLRETVTTGFDGLRELVTNGFTELKELSQQQAETARLQADSVSRLITLWERDRTAGS